MKDRKRRKYPPRQKAPLDIDYIYEPRRAYKQAPRERTAHWTDDPRHYWKGN